MMIYNYLGRQMSSAGQKVLPSCRDLQLNPKKAACRGEVQKMLPYPREDDLTVSILLTVWATSNE